MVLLKRFALGGSVLGTCAVFACSSSSTPHSGSVRVLVGTVEGTDAQVAVVASAHRARIYFCGGDSSYPALTHWFTADVDASGAIRAEADAPGDWSIEGQVGGADAAGAVTVADGTRLTFRATNVAGGTIAGLYEAAAPCGKVGLIVTQPSAQAAPSGQGACIHTDVRPSVEQVNPIAPLIRATDGTIRVLVAGTAAALSVLPAAAP